MPEQLSDMIRNKISVIKICIDVISAIFVISEFFIIPIWGINFNKFPIIIHGLPAPMFLLAVGVLPFCFGAIWLLARVVMISRYENAWKGKLMLYVAFSALGIFVIVLKILAFLEE